MKGSYALNRSYKERYDLIRHPDRIRSSDIIEAIFEDLFFYDSPDPSLIAAKGKINGQECMILGQEKRRQGKESKATGMLNSKGFGFALQMLDEAERQKIPIISFIDTFGGDTSMESEIGGQSFLISDCISRYCAIETATVSYVIGEGGSGGALALQVADKGFMLENALYSVIAPESCSRIIFHKRLAQGENIEDTIEDSLEVLRPGADHIKDIGMIDEILPEPAEGAHVEYDFTVDVIKKSLSETLDMWVSKSNGKKYIADDTIKNLVAERRKKVLNYGEFYKSLDELATRTVEGSHDEISTIDIDREDFYTHFIIKAHLEREGIEDTELVECTKEWDKDRGLFRVAGGCGFISYKQYKENYYACPKCGKGEYLSVEEQIDKISDKDTFLEIECDLTINKLKGNKKYNFGKYKHTLEKLCGKTFSKEGLVTGQTKINGQNVVLIISDLKFIGGSFGAAFGEKFKRAVDFAVKNKFPMISICASGGARMNEGPMALAQMAKMNMSLLDLKKAGILFLSVITGPTTGGAYASYVTQGDIMIGEKGSLVEFAGPRVVTGAGFEVDSEVVCTDHLFKTKKLQHLVDRKELKEVLSYYVNIFYTITQPNNRSKIGRIMDFRKPVPVNVLSEEIVEV